MKRFVLIVLDSVGVGALPDAHEYGDEGSNTLANTANKVGGLDMPNLQAWGLGNIIPINGVAPSDSPVAAWGKMGEQSAGKDTTTGHWEIAGIHLEKPFPTYPNGFPIEVIEAFEQSIGRKTLGNYPASGTEIIQQLGEEHLSTGFPIVYTSADSVFQIAAHEEIVPIEQLYHWCEIARNQLQGEHGVGRVIARPFVGAPGDFQRTPRRKDYSLKPVTPTVLDGLTQSGIPVYGVGKIQDIFAGQGVSDNIKSQDNMDTVDKTLLWLADKKQDCLIFANLVDFDMSWGHRNDYQSYGKGLEEFDRRIPELISALEADDILCIVADHGCDPTTMSTDHSREYVPLLVYGDNVKPVDLGVRTTFADVAQTIADYFDLPQEWQGESFLGNIWKG